MKLLLKIGIYTLAGLLLLLCTLYWVAWRYKDEIMASVKEEFSTRINGELLIKDMDYDLLADFPDFSFTLVEPAIKDSLFPVHGQYLFQADKVYLQLSLFKLIHRDERKIRKVGQQEVYIQSVILENASVNLFKDKNNYSNLSVFRRESIQKESTASSPPAHGLELSLKKITWKNVAFSYVDSSTRKTIRFQLVSAITKKQETDSLAVFGVNGRVHFDSLTFNPQRGSFVKNKAADIGLLLRYEPAKKQLSVFPSQIKIEKEEYQVAGNILFGKPGSLSLVFSARKADLTKILPLLTENIAGKLRRFTVDRPVSAIAKLSTQLSPGYVPQVGVAFMTRKASVTYKGQTFTDVTMTGRFVNQLDSARPHGDDNSAVVVNRFRGRYENIPFKAAYTVTNLKEPDITIKADADFSLREARHLLDESKMTLDRGSATIAFTYTGKLAGVLDDSNHSLPGKLRGTIAIKNGTFQYIPRQFTFSKINTNLSFNESDIEIKNLDLSLNTNAMHARGKMKDFFSFILYGKGKLHADVAMNMPAFQFDVHFPFHIGSLNSIGLVEGSGEGNNGIQLAHQMFVFQGFLFEVIK